MLMTKYKYKVVLREDGSGGDIPIWSLTDERSKTFYQANIKDEQCVKSVSSFMDSITDELADGYWPKPKKAKEKKDGS